jgi:hypothetical protein
MCDCAMYYFGALAHDMMLFAGQTSDSPGLVTAELARVGGIVRRHLKR